MSEAKEHLTNELRKHFSTPEAEELTEAIVGLIAVISGGPGQPHKLSKAEQIAADDKAAIEAHQAKLKAEAAAAAEAHQAELDAADAERARINEQAEQAEAEESRSGMHEHEDEDEHEDADEGDAHEARDAALHHAKPKGKKKRK